MKIKIMNRIKSKSKSKIRNAWASPRTVGAPNGLFQAASNDSGLT
jgi:hypothetical protein